MLCPASTVHKRKKVKFLICDPLTVDKKKETCSNMRQNNTITPPPTCAVDRLMTKGEIVKINNMSINVCLEPLLHKVFHTESMLTYQLLYKQNLFHVQF